MAKNQSGEDNYVIHVSVTSTSGERSNQTSIQEAPNYAEARESADKFVSDQQAKNSDSRVELESIQNLSDLNIYQNQPSASR